MDFGPQARSRLAWSSVVVVASVNTGVLLLYVLGQGILEGYAVRLGSAVWVRASAGVVAYLCLVSFGRLMPRLSICLAFSAITIWVLSRSYLLRMPHEAVRTLSGGTGEMEFVAYCYSGSQEWNSVIAAIQLVCILLLASCGLVSAGGGDWKGAHRLKVGNNGTSGHWQFSVADLVTFVAGICVVIIVARRIQPYPGWYASVFRGMFADHATGSIPLIGEAAFSALLIAVSSHFLILRRDRLSGLRYAGCRLVAMLAAAWAVRASLERISQGLFVRAFPSIERGFHWDSVLADTIIPPLAVFFALLVLLVWYRIFRRRSQCKHSDGANLAKEIRE